MAPWLYCCGDITDVSVRCQLWALTCLHHIGRVVGMRPVEEMKPISRRRVRVISYLGFHGPNIGMWREVSPRKVECCWCGTATMGNDEERIRIKVHTGMTGDLGSLFWKRYKTLYFHPQCLVSFTLGEDVVPGIRTGQRLRTTCHICYRFGQRMKQVHDGTYRCKHCYPYYEAQRAEAEIIATGLEEIASSDS